ncbi:MAG: DMT family transporter [Alphaproteobacteria bacterium]|nr:DMT family transporter [Alphaproteobacteria bacterium]
MKLTRLQADGLLFFTTIVWGGAFVAQKFGNAQIDPSMFVGIRFAIAALLLFPFAYRERTKAPIKQASFWLYIAIGLCLAMANIIQQWGLTMTRVTNSGFITSLYAAMVPFAALFINKTPLRLLPTLAAVIAVAGAWLLSTNGQSISFDTGDLITLVSDIGWALQIIFIARAVKLDQQPLWIAFVQYAVTAAIGIALGLFGKPLTWHDLSLTMTPLLYTGVLSSAIGFTLPCIALRYTPEAEGAVIMSLEGVFCALAGAIFFDDKLSVLGMAGCGLIFLGVLMVELSPLLTRQTKTAG